LCLASFIRSRSRSRVEAFVLGILVFRIPLLTALMDSLEERIVEALDHDDELLLGQSRSGPQQESCSRGKQKRFLHVGSPPLNIPFVRHAPLQAPASRRWPAGGPRHPPKTGNRAFS